MQITWLGTATMMITCNNHKLLLDPYLRSYNKKLPAFPLNKIADTDAIFITHPHIDHFADIPIIMQYTSCPIYVNARGVALAKQNKFDMSRIKQIDVGDEFDFGSLTIKAYQGKHVQYDKKCIKDIVARAFKKGKVIVGLKLQSLNKKFSIDPNADVFAYYLRDGEHTVLVLGSANISDSVKYPASDILVYPYQGKSDMLDYSLNLVKSLAPKTVIVDHFDDAFPPLTTRMNVEEFQSRLENESDIRVIIPDESEKILLSIGNNFC